QQPVAVVIGQTVQRQVLRTAELFRRQPCGDQEVRAVAGGQEASTLRRGQEAGVVQVIENDQRTRPLFQGLVDTSEGQGWLFSFLSREHSLLNSQGDHQLRPIVAAGGADKITASGILA